MKEAELLRALAAGKHFFCPGRYVETSPLYNRPTVGIKAQVALVGEFEGGDWDSLTPGDREYIEKFVTSTLLRAAGFFEREGAV